MPESQRIAARISDLDYYIKVINNILPKTLEAYSKAKPETKAAVERYLQIVSEIEMDVLTVIYRTENLKIAGTEGSMLNNLESVVGKALVSNVRKRRNLRNELVHAYSDIKDSDVYALASNLKDLEEFKREMAKLAR